MIVSCEIGADELKVFMDEAEEHIQLLDEDIIKLEQEGDNQALLKEVFRAAHTLKGSSAMLGHERMTEVAHAMESLLDKLRNRTININSDVTDALLLSLDALKQLKGEVVSQKESDVDIRAVVGRINRAAEGAAGAATGAAASKAPSGGGAAWSRQLTLTRTVEKKVAALLKKGLAARVVRVQINRKSEWLAVRNMQVYNELSQLGELVVAHPNMQDIEQEKVDPEFVSIVCCSVDGAAITAKLGLVSDVEQVFVAEYGSAEAAGLLNPAAMQVEGPAQTLQEPKAAEPRAEEKPADGNGKGESLQSIRVDVTVLDSLMNMVEELVIDRSRISQVGKQLEGKYPDDELVGVLGDTSNHIIKIINELYQDIMKVRMVPISAVFSKFPRMVRDLAQKQQKNVDFIITGEGTELDRTIIEKIQDPLIHLLRNAVDHGIETPGERVDRGKPARATLRLSAFQEEGHIVIKLEDDGRGIDPVKVKNSAVRKGFLTAEAAAKMTDAEAMDLIFSSGMSTAEKATEVSGRGVGLDIVRTNIERLNGNVALSTQVNVGTTFTIKLPLTVAVFHGLVVAIADSSFIVPLISVMETLRIKKKDIKTIQAREVMTLRDGIVPLMRISKVLGTRQEVAKDEEYVLVVRAGEKVAGIVVDELKEQMEFVIKPLGKYLGELKGIAGATILGDGQVALILDIPTLIRMFSQQEAGRNNSNGHNNKGNGKTGPAAGAAQ